MKIKLPKPRIPPIASPYGVPNIDGLKREVSLVEIMRFHLDQEGIEMADKVMFSCWRKRSHSNGDEHESLWCYDDYRDTGIGRWGCQTCCPQGDDVYGLLRQLHDYSMTQALQAVQVWALNHRPSIRVRPSARTLKKGSD